MNKGERIAAGRIAGEVRRLRTERGWSQLALAERAEMSLNYVSLIERAERLPSVEVLLRLAGVLGTTIAGLVADAPAEGDPWIVETSAILRAIPADTRPIVLGILRATLDAAAPNAEGSGVRPKRRRK